MTRLSSKHHHHLHPHPINRSLYGTTKNHTKITATLTILLLTGTTVCTSFLLPSTTPPRHRSSSARLSSSSSWPSIVLANGELGENDNGLSELREDVVMEMNETVGGEATVMPGDMGETARSSREEEAGEIEDAPYQEELLKVNLSGGQEWRCDDGGGGGDDGSDVLPVVMGRECVGVQEKHIPLTVRYSGQVPGLRSFYLTTAQKITRANPDVVVEKMILPAVEGESVFEVLVDNRVVIGKGMSKWQSVGRGGGIGSAGSGMSVFISMQEVNAAIAKARRKRRPTTAYVRGAEEGDTPAVRLEMLRAGRNGKENHSWED